MSFLRVTHTGARALDHLLFSAAKLTPPLTNIHHANPAAFAAAAAATTQPTAILSQSPPPTPLPQRHNNTATTSSLADDETMLPVFRRLVLAPATSSKLNCSPAAGLLQRAYNSSSSSKPSSPADGSSPRATPPSPFAPQTASRASVKQRNTGGGGIPFVPSTDHMRPHDIALSTFFALHRPISITSPQAPGAARPAARKAEQLRPWDFGVPFEPPPVPVAEVVDETATEERAAYLISVKRQRRLKMKKHKYKKLMKKTRNLRRRIERQKN